ncbi:MAG TPA: family 1 glycosylhydrolase [Oculatellaceae cyanobacterium]
MSKAPFLDFPNGFLWGAATSHFQIEGHPGEAGKRLSDWSAWTVLDGKISDRSNADKACEFFLRHASDREICRQLNLNAFRLSLNWPVLCPEPPVKGEIYKFDQEAVDYYRRLLSGFKEDGTKTFVTLFHFTLPSWIAQTGGWASPSSVEQFAQFTELAVKNFGDLVDFWVTINEPLAYAYQGYVAAIWPPGHSCDYLGAFKTVRYMLESHARAYEILHANDSNAQVGFATHWRPFVPKRRWSPLDNLVSFYRNSVFNEMFPQAVHTGELRFPYPISTNAEVMKLCGPIPKLKGAMDYFGLNYYTRELSEFQFAWPVDVFGKLSKNPELETNCLGWEIYPDGMYRTLTEDLAPFKFNLDGTLRPIYITENGFPMPFEHTLHEGDWSIADDLRVQYLTSHLHAVHRAIKDGAAVKGYLYWSLLDNFEWAEGLLPRFGLVRVSYPTQERSLRKSALIYADIARLNGLTPASF